MAPIRWGSPGGSFEGVMVANPPAADIPERADQGRNNWPPGMSRLPRGGVALLFEIGQFIAEDVLRPENSALPLRLSDFEPADGFRSVLRVTLHRHGRYDANAWIRKGVSAEDMQALRGVIASIRPWAPPRPDQHIGECVGGWMGMAPPTGHGILSLRPRALSVESPSDAWVVGSYDRVVPAKGKHPPMSAEVPITLHWDGSRWALVYALAGEQMDDVVAIAPNDAWAVGRRGSGSRIKHWDGERWRFVPSPAMRFVSQEGKVVAATGPDDVWVVGTVAEHGWRIAALRWDGVSWTRSSLPDFDRSVATGVAASSPKDAWVIGSRANRHRALASRWDGKMWRSTDTRALRSSSLGGVVALGPDDAWAVGSTRRRVPGDSFAQALVAHWDGSTWRPASIPRLPRDTFLYDISASGPTDVWALGWSNAPEAAVLLHFDGESWTKVPPPIRHYSFLTDVAAVPGGGAWVVGDDGALTWYQPEHPVLARSC